MDLNLQIRHIIKFIRDYVKYAKAAGVVVGLSGGVDSTVVAFLAVRALGKSKVEGLLMFEESRKTSKDYKDAREIASNLGIVSYDLKLTPILHQFKRSLGNANLSRANLGNITARCRMILAYAHANQSNLLVIGTGDRSEEELGYFTKYGDGGVDFQPIAHLYKTQVRRLARKLGVQDEIINKPSSPNLWEGHLAIDEIPADYPVLDKVLNLLYMRQLKLSAVAKKSNISQKTVNDIRCLHDKNAHKRKPPPTIEDKWWKTI